MSKLGIYATPWARGAMTDAEWETIRGLDLDGQIAIFGKSARGPFTIRLNVRGIPEIRGEGSTVALAIASAVRQVAAA